MEETFAVYGLPVFPEVIKRIWEEIRDELANEYPIVKEIRLPAVQAFIMPSKKYLKLKKQLLTSTHIIDQSEAEWGDKLGAGDSSAALFYSDVQETWVIIKRQGYGYTPEHDLKHELTHIYERILLLPWGSLTKK
jgi:hypothetical protein